MATPLRVGILGAMEPEVRGLVAAMDVEGHGRNAGFDYWLGNLAGHDCVVARCGMGKVSAAAGVQRLIDQFTIGCIAVCGLAGGLRTGLNVGDVVVGERFVQHDLDASPIYPRFEVPGLGLTYFDADASLVGCAELAAREFLRAFARDNGAARALGITEPAVHRGLIVTGDQFVKDDKHAALVAAFPDALCVEMEGGAVAHVCHLNSVPFVIVRVISDSADASAAIDFKRFVESVAPAYAVGIVSRLLARLS
jgi:adenosylhomocysteine nucleosidase